MKRTIEIRLDKWTRRLLCAVAALLAIIAAELWAGLPAGRPALAQIPDSGRQRQDLLEESRRTNRLLSEIVEHLKSGTLKVDLADTDKQRAKAPLRVRG